ncbi:MAG: hypothetical protein ABJB76_01145 [Candidatus Nitrosocosmicus sp.]
MSIKYPFWPFYSGIGCVLFGILLIVLKVGIRISFIFFIIALFLLGIWIYFIVRIDIKKNKKKTQVCTCPICSHEQSDICIQEKCPCCISMKDNIVMGHSNNSLQ